MGLENWGCTDVSGYATTRVQNPPNPQDPGSGYYSLTADRVQSDLSTADGIALMETAPNLGEPGMPVISMGIVLLGKRR